MTVPSSYGMRARGEALEGSRRRRHRLLSAPPAGSPARAAAPGDGFTLDGAARAFMAGALGVAAEGRTGGRARPTLTPGGAGRVRDARVPCARAAAQRRLVGVNSIAAARHEKWVYDFSEGSREMRDLLGGKGANVAEMTRIGGAGARARRASRSRPRRASPTCAAAGRSRTGLEEQVDEALARLEQQTGKRLGDAEDPLLVSVRSGARESMPGMLDTVLNLGPQRRVGRGPDRAHRQRALRAGTPTAASCRCSATSCAGIDGARVRGGDRRSSRTKRGVELDTELDAEDLRELTASFKRIFEEQTGEEFPQEPREQLRQAIEAVFDSWNGERAVDYRRLNRIPDDWGTAVNVQQMVFGNKGETLRLGRRLQPRREHRRAASRRGDFLPERPGRGRRLRACATRATSRSSRT